MFSRTMFWANFLHIYQPTQQQPDILEAVVAESYRPMFLGLKKNPKAKITLNINGALVELFDKYKYHDLLDLLRELGKNGQIEFTGSAKYHTFLPLINEQETIRQININDETNKYFLGEAYSPKGFFPPEMGYTEDVSRIIDELGFEWIILDEIACHGSVESVDYTKLHKIKNTNLYAYFRERRISNLIMSAVARTSKKLKETIKQDLKSGKYVITAMDGETFGHHRPGLENLLFDIFKDPDFKLITISEIKKHYKETEEVSPHKSTWASSELDMERGVQFLSWSDPDNPIHAWQHELSNLALKKVYQLCGSPDKQLKAYSKPCASLRKNMDIALASDHFWWASAKPWWSIEMIEDGAFRLLEIVRQSSSAKDNDKTRAAELYEKIVSTAFDWQRTGKIREMAKQQDETLRIPFKDRTIGKNESWKYDAFIDMMEELEKKAAKNQEYEEAILWRNAIYKLKNKLDIYDSLNAVNLLRTKIPNEDVENIIEKYKKDYYRIRGGQPEQRE